ncbi:glycoside hydrolase [Ralstonia solanacearum]|nr:glycoside hydrolase [Ralstonia solanacearum]BEU65712.1 hypothetical protein MAFF301069_02670 [Ralstonia pseudosolanacearum]NKA67731.1 glycoside hydrolase [Ralstonia solanacearum]NKA85788.1 glycoside hydrolase [Ralstonia solanacearum]NKF57663.1 glycoside hydrolase [Ralstonia solanacearum]
MGMPEPPITQAQAEAYLAVDLVTALNATLRYCPVLAAIVDFTFNLGGGAVADFDLAAAGQPARLVRCCKRTAPLGLRWRQGAAGAGRTSRGRSGFIAIELR